MYQQPPRKDPEQYRLAIRRPVTTTMLFLTLIVFGWKSYQELPIKLMPDITYPTLTIRTEYEGAAPEDVEQLLTRPLEETLSIVSGLVEISSISSPGLSEIMMEFTWDTDMNTAQQDVRDRLDLFTPPRGVTERPVILRYDPTLDPVLRVAITGSPPSLDRPFSDAERRQELAAIRNAAERDLKSDLEAEVGIAQALIKGGTEEEVEVLVDSELLKNKGVPLDAVVTALAQQNINLSGGSLREGKTEYLVRTLNEFQTVEEISDIIVASPGGRQMRLNQVARVFLGHKDRRTIARIDGREAVTVDIFKEGDANTVDVCNRVKDLLDIPRAPTATERFLALVRRGMPEAPGAPAANGTSADTGRVASRLPHYAQTYIVSDQSQFITASIREVQSAAIYGGLLALVILYFFLRELRSTFFIGVAIPISVIATFVPMFMRGLSLNIMSLGGLALGIGMLVDNSIVVLESIFRCKEEGDDPVQAAERGTGEVASAVTASTLTTIAVFLPIAFVEGIAGQLFEDLALTVTFSLIASLLVSLYLLPMLASRRPLGLLAERDVVWVLRVYRRDRAEGGYSRGRALLMLLPHALRDLWRWLLTTSKATLEATITPFTGTGPWNAGRIARALLGVLLSPMLVVLLALQLAMQTVAVLVVTALFPAIALVALAVTGLALLGRAVLWPPLELFDRTLKAVRGAYGAVLPGLLRLSPVILLITVLLAGHAVYTARDLGRELIPPLKQGEFGLRMAAPPGTRLEETERRAMQLERVIMAHPDVGTVSVDVGQGDSGATSTEKGENTAEFTIVLRNPERDARRQDEIVEELRQQVSRVTPDEVSFTLPTLFSFKTAVEVQIRGEDAMTLRDIGRQAQAAIADVPGLADLELSVREGYPEVIVELDRDLLASRNMAPGQVAQRLRTEVQGDVASRFSRRGEKIDIRVRSNRERLSSVEDLRSLSVTDGHPPVPLQAVAHITERAGPSEVRRIDQRQVVLLRGNVEGRDLGSVTEDIMERLRHVDMPNDYHFVLGGQRRELETSYNSLIFALALAVFLVYVVMACQFESVWHPALIMFSVPLAFIGVVYVLYFLAIPLSIVVFLGGIVLAGIVVNDAIVLVDYINQLRRRGLAKTEAIVTAGQVRMRPILMTTLTTVLGLVPMALWAGEGSEMRQPMAITVMAGLASATVLTLVIIPMVYYLFGGRDAPKPGVGFTQ